MSPVLRPPKSFRRRAIHPLSSNRGEERVRTQCLILKPSRNLTQARGFSCTPRGSSRGDQQSRLVCSCSHPPLFYKPELTMTLSSTACVESITQGIDFGVLAVGFAGEANSSNSRRASRKGNRR